jgi:hypothetical protein
MPIVFVHGVAARDVDRHYASRAGTIVRLLRHYVAPVISDTPDRVAILDAYWGDIGVQFAWHGASCPPGRVAGWRHHPLGGLLPSHRRDHLWHELRRRGLAVPGHLTARAASTARRRLNREAAVLLGDALHYFVTRGAGSRPGPIPLRVLDALRAAENDPGRLQGEPLVVLSHSLGGQIVYDLVTHFLPALDDERPPRIDFWAAASSQIGLFEEMKLCLASRLEHGPGRPAPFPNRHFLGAWWNMWDPHDFFSYTAAGIIDGVDDSPYDSGLSLTTAHYGCLESPSFYALLAHKLRAAGVEGTWHA